MKLVIVESPAKAKTIEKYLGTGYTVKASVGHVRDLPKSNKNAIDVPGGFIPHYQIVPEKREIIADLKKAVSKADEVLLATDPDREGEAIAWHLAQALDLEGTKAPSSAKATAGKKNKKVKRIVFHEITKDAILEAVAHPRDIDNHLREAQEARRVLDRLVGYDLSGLIWKKVRYGLSAGRVQSPALRIVMEREREIRAFIPENYWVITADVQTNQPAGRQGKKEKLTLTCEEEPRDEKKTNTIVEKARAGTWSVASVKETENQRQPRAPFTTSTIQQSASTRLGFSPSRTMRAAQKLYEKGFITYMRTDSTNLAAQAQTQILAVVTKEFGKEFARPMVYASKSKNAQEAHEAIRPTNAETRVAGSDDDEKKLYELIWARAISSQMAPAKLLQTKITTTIGDESVPPFSATGSRVLFPGWLLADPDSRGEDVEMPKVIEGDSLNLLDVTALAKQTQPPSRYSEAGLIKELEKRGIGRPSTYASIIRTIEERGYVTRENRTLTPTDTGDVVSTFLEKHFATYISDSFTSEMENELDEIALGTREYEKTLRAFYIPFAKDVAKKTKEAEKITNMGDAPKEFVCPKCGSAMVMKLARNGKFMSCGRFPDCDGARSADGKEVTDPEEIGFHPETKEPIFVLDGPYGPYVQLGLKTTKNKKPRRSSIPKEKDPVSVTLEEAVIYLSLPRVLGLHPETKKDVVANVGRFGPYIGHDGDFRSLKTDDVYTVTLERALAILQEPKKFRGKRRFTKKK
ncbi:MAG: type I DNA topoisomerase [Candidatus Campbellbacteria bacterium]|nr:type I DNA topoisomerase [Candidatus Campbellbacteria bacterium]